MTFPVLLGMEKRNARPSAYALTSVPWEMVAPFEGSARRNHGGQSLATLAERGGLSVHELNALLNRATFGVNSLGETFLREPYPQAEMRLWVAVQNWKEAQLNSINAFDPCI